MAYEGFVFSADQHLRIVRAFGRTPYLPASGGGSSVQSAEDVVTNVEKLAVELQRVANDHTRCQDELRELHSDIAAMRRLFQIGSGNAEG